MSLITQRFAESIQRSNENSAMLNNLRRTRNLLLEKCDWTQLPDNGLSDSKRAQWKTYRQALRDLPNNTDFNNVVWPEQP